MPYISISKSDKKEMLASIGVSSIEELFKDIPESVRSICCLNVPAGVSDLEAETALRQISEKNISKVSFLGAGAYQHYVPAAVDELSSRSEFYTAYTPYQPEISQGTLTVIFEFQTMICSLTGMDVTNASMYDGATSLAEAAMMAVRNTGKNKIAVSGSVNPNYIDVLKTYCWAAGIELVLVPHENGTTSFKELEKIMDDKTAAIAVQSPNFFGCIEDQKKIADIAHSKNGELISVITEPFSLGILKSPGECGADIVCGELQAFGNRIGFGGPMLGFISCKSEYVRKMPGRLVGETVDAEGKKCYCLTIQTREQHIRRERATSNICSNEGLVALRSVIFLSLTGPKLKRIAEINHSAAVYLKNGLEKLGFTLVFKNSFFNEFVVKHDKIKSITEGLQKAGYQPWLLLDKRYPELESSALVCATELHSKAIVDDFLDSIKKFI